MRLQPRIMRLGSTEGNGTARLGWPMVMVGTAAKMVRDAFVAESQIDVATTHPEFDRWQWVDMRRLPVIVVSFKRQLYLHLVGEFGIIVGD